jgi:FMN phosphatase YigB (HAD superfamily)
LLVGLAGNQSRTMEAWARSTLPADIVTSSDGLGARKPDQAFFERLVELAGVEAGELAYVGDRVDNDVLPALGRGLVAVHVRRGPWGRLRPTPDGAVGVDSLDELPAVLLGPA